MPIDTQSTTGRVQQALSAASLSAKCDELDKLDHAVLAAAAGDVMPHLLNLCRLDGPSPAHVLLSAWKSLSRLVMAAEQPQLAQPLLRDVFDFVVEQIRENVLTHDWTDPKRTKLAKFSCVQALALVRANPLAAFHTVGLKVVHLFHEVNLRAVCGNWVKDQAQQNEVAMSVVIRLEAALGAMGGCRELQHAHRKELLTYCSMLPSDSLGDQRDRDSPSPAWTRTAAASSFLCCIAVFREIQSVVATSAECAELLRVLLAWLPGVSHILAKKGDSLEGVAQRFPSLFSVIAQTAELLPPVVFSSSLTFAESRVSAQEISLAHRWWTAARRIIALRPQICLDGDFLGLLLAALTVSNAVSLDLVESVWITLLTCDITRNAAEQRTIRLHILSVLLWTGVRCYGEAGASPGAGIERRQVASSTARIIRTFWNVPGAVEHKRILAQQLSDSSIQRDASLRRGSLLQAARCHIHLTDSSSSSSTVLTLIGSTDALPDDVEAVQHAVRQFSSAERTQLMSTLAASCRFSSRGQEPLSIPWDLLSVATATLFENQMSPSTDAGALFATAIGCCLNALDNAASSNALLERRFVLFSSLVMSSVAVDSTFFTAHPEHLSKLRQLIGRIVSFAASAASSPRTAEGDGFKGAVLLAEALRMLKHLAFFSTLDMKALLRNDDHLALLAKAVAAVEGSPETNQAPPEVPSDSCGERKTPNSPIFDTFRGKESSGMPLMKQRNPETSPLLGLAAVLCEMEAKLRPYCQSRCDRGAAGSLPLDSETLTHLARVYSMLGDLLPHAGDGSPAAVGSGSASSPVVM